MNTLPAIAIILIGLLSLLGAVLDWNWFIANRKVRIFVRLLGRTGARILYAILGGILMGYGGTMLAALL
ncbi:MAG TPA: Imm17 family immunity protein [Anaerolineales bacterium]|nr:Imm17 family immunity protein [Anaerolineales bacterium]